jgi:hypothetical protein
MALGDNITKYEELNGTITFNDGPAIPINFGGPTGQA